jgi:hypothetical protein
MHHQKTRCGGFFFISTLAGDGNQFRGNRQRSNDQHVHRDE